VRRGGDPYLGPIEAGPGERRLGMRKAMVVGLVLASVCLVVSAVWADEPAGAGEGLAGFRGLVKGTIVSKGEGQFVIKVDSLVKTYPANKAAKPENVAGKQLTVKVVGERLLHALAERKAGEVVEAGLLNDEGGAWTSIEMIRRAEAAAAPAASPAPAAGNDETAKLRARVSEMEKTIATLRAQNEELRKKLQAAGGTAPK
jgi:hypothetical protein